MSFKCIGCRKFFNCQGEVDWFKRKLEGLDTPKCFESEDDEEPEFGIAYYKDKKTGFIKIRHLAVIK